MNRTADQREGKAFKDAPTIDADVEKLRVIEQFVATLACAAPYVGLPDAEGRVPKAFATAHEPMLKAVWQTLAPMFPSVEVAWGDDAAKRNRTYTAKWLWSTEADARHMDGRAG